MPHVDLEIVPAGEETVPSEASKEGPRTQPAAPPLWVELFTIIVKVFKMLTDLAQYSAIGVITWKSFSDYMLNNPL